jgi:hypothetical protein
VDLVGEEYQGFTYSIIQVAGPREIVRAHALCVIHKAKIEEDASFAGIFTYFVQKLK